MTPLPAQTPAEVLGFSRRCAPFLVPVLLLVLVGCVYPRRRTSLSPISEGSVMGVPPAHLVRVTFQGATVPPRPRSGLEWDEDGTPPDPFVRLHRNGELIYESEPAEDALEATFDAAITENLELPPNAELRLELWDDDPVRPQPIGVWHGTGLPRSAIPGADVRVQLEGRAEIVFRVGPAQAFRGSGVLLYEARKSELRLVEVIPLSPMGRAGLGEGDAVLAIDGAAIGDLSEGDAASRLSRVGHEEATLRVRHADGTEDEIEIDTRPVWRAR